MYIHTQKYVSTNKLYIYISRRQAKMRFPKQGCICPIVARWVTLINPRHFWPREMLVKTAVCMYNTSTLCTKDGC